MRPPDRVIAYIALGANLDDPVRQVRNGFAALAALPDTQLLRCSSLYRSAPVGVGDQPAYVNAVAAVATGLAPLDLLAALLDTERCAGRVRKGGGEPRTLDLDLLLYDDRRLAEPGLVVPHPRLHLRAFVVMPLLEVAPDLRLPGRGTLAAWLPAVGLQEIERLAPELDLETRPIG